MADRLIVDVEADGRVVVSSWLDGEFAPSPVAEAREQSWPVDEGALEDLRWYAEDYLRLPYGVYEDRGAAVAGRIRGWGEALFQMVLGGGGARDAYVTLNGRGDVARELVVRSEAPEVLRLPWELLWDPQRREPLALEWAGVSRSLPAGNLSASHAPSGERLRVLMVIARPAGVEDVGYRMIARPLLSRLEAVAGEVELEVLRPATFEAFQGAVRAAAEDGRPYQMGAARLK